MDEPKVIDAEFEVIEPGRPRVRADVQAVTWAIAYGFAGLLVSGLFAAIRAIFF